MTEPLSPTSTGTQRCGLVAIVGKPNVGKSTLLNALVGQKISITSRKAQTTRHRITGIRSTGDTQFIFVDTPGFQTDHANALNRSLNKTVMGAVSDVDLVLFVVECGQLCCSRCQGAGAVAQRYSGIADCQQARQSAPPRATSHLGCKKCKQRHPFARVHAHVGQKRQGH